MSLSGRRPIFTTRAACSWMREVGSRSTPGSGACGSTLPQPLNGIDATGPAAGDAGGADGAGRGGADGAGGVVSATGSSSKRSTGPSSGLPTWITHGPSMFSREIRSAPA